MKKYFFILVIVFLNRIALADFGIEISRDAAETSFGNNLSLNYSLDTFIDNETEEVGLMHQWGYGYSNSQSKQNLNSSMADFEIKKIGHNFSYDLIFFEDLTLSVSYLIEKLNDEEAVHNSLSGGLYYQLFDFQFGYLSSNSDTIQKKQVVVLQDLTDQIRFNQKSSTYYLSAQWTEKFLTSFSYTSYSYDKNLDNLYLTLTTIALLNRAGPSVASEISSQLKNSADLNFSYSFNESWLMNLGLGVSQDYLAPSGKTKSISLSVEYEIESNDVYYSMFASATGAKADDYEQVSSSGVFGLGLSF